MQLLPVERIRMKNGEVIDLSLPRSSTYVNGGLIITGTQRTDQGVSNRILFVDDIDTQVTLGIDGDGEVVEVPEAPLPSLR